jgi:hypothetical protein
MISPRDEPRMVVLQREREREAKMAKNGFKLLDSDMV